jgi:hypothetical protein
MSTIPDQFHRRAQWQNNAITKADVQLESAELPTYTEVVTQLDELLDWIGGTPGAHEAEPIAKCRAIIKRACGPGMPAEQRQIVFAQMFGRITRKTNGDAANTKTTELDSTQ